MFFSPPYVRLDLKDSLIHAAIATIRIVSTSDGTMKYQSQSNLELSSSRTPQQALLVDSPPRRKELPKDDGDRAEIDLPVASGILGGESLYLQVDDLLRYRASLLASVINAASSQSYDRRLHLQRRAIEAEF